MPWRSGAPLVEIMKPAALSAPTTVGPVHPGLGCAAQPTGLLITTMSSSSYTISNPSIGVSGIGIVLIGAGRSTSITCPALTRSDLSMARLEVVMSPSSRSFTTAVRDRPNTRVSALSIRSPATPSGTASVRSSRLLMVVHSF